MKTFNLNVPDEMAQAFAKKLVTLMKNHGVEVENKEALDAMRPITERIKTFEDALEELGEDNQLVKEYWAVANVEVELSADIMTYLKLRIIVAALNEGWEPQFTTDEYRYFPWFWLYTKEKYDQMDEEQKGRCVLCSGGGANAHYGFVSVRAGSDASYSNTYYGSRLAFRTRELAAYAGRQFIEEWADFVFKPRTSR